MTVDTTFVVRRKAQLFAEMCFKQDPVVAGKWLTKNVSKKELEEIHKYLEKELEKYAPAD